MALILTNHEVAQAMNAAEYVDAMEEAFRAYGANAAVNSLRVDACLPLDRYTPAVRGRVERLIEDLPLDADPVYAPETMAAAKRAEEVVYRLKTNSGGYPECGVVAVRISTHFDTQTRVGETLRRVKLPLAPGWQFMSMVVLLSLETGEVLGLIPDSHIQRMRVGGTTALGVKHMAREDASRVALLGSGAQAQAALECVATVRKLERVRVYSPTAANRARFAESMRRKLDLDVLAVDSAQMAFEEADIVLTATSSYEPVYEPQWLRPGMHLGIGTLLEEEVETFPLSRAIVVSLRPFGGSSDFVQNYVMGSRNEPTFGQLINKQSARFDWERMIELGDILNGRASGRESAEEITHHINNNGCGMQFAAAGARVLANARRMGLGFELPGELFLQKEHT
jgi:alanine dehydrogenase